MLISHASCPERGSRANDLWFPLVGWTWAGRCSGRGCGPVVAVVVVAVLAVV